nr:CHAT domain-containing protein [Pseudoroseomonas coralli]
MLVLGAPALAQQVPGAEPMLRQAQALAAAGDAGGALSLLEAWLAPGQAGISPEAAVPLRILAANVAVQLGDARRARAHLEAAEAAVRGLASASGPLASARALRDLAQAWQGLGDLGQADKALSAALPVLEAVAPEEGASVANARGLLRREMLRLAEAQADFARSLALLRAAARLPSDAPDPRGEAATQALANLALTRMDAGDVEGARHAVRRAYAATGADQRLWGAVALVEADVLLHGELDMVGAQARIEQVLAMADVDDPLHGHARLAQAISFFERGRMSEAAEAAEAAVETYRVALGERDPAFARALHTLGTALAELGGEAEAGAAFTRAAELLRETLGPLAPSYHATEVEHGWLDLRNGDLLSAENRARAALAAYAEAPPPDTRPEGLATILLGLVAEARSGKAAAESRPAEAEAEVEEAARLYRRGQALIGAAQGSVSPDLSFSLLRLGRMLGRSGRYVEAMPPVERAIALQERLGGVGTVRLADALTARAELRRGSGDIRGALRDVRDAYGLLSARVRGVEGAGGAGARAQRRSVRQLFLTQASLLLELAPEDQAAREVAFAASQEAAASRAGEALHRTAARLAAVAGRDSALVSLLRRLDSAEDLLRQADAQVLAWAVRPGPDPTQQGMLRMAARERALQRLLDIQEAIAAQAPALSEFLSPGAAAMAELQASLAADEALLAPLLGEDGLLLWVATKDAVQALRLPGRRAEMAGLVARLRAGVDLDAASGQLARLPRFDGAAAKALHAALIAPAEATGLLTGKVHLLIVPDAELQSLPPQLIFDPARGWLPRRYATTLIPSIRAAVAAHAAQRQPSAAPKAFLGVGNPLSSPPEPRIMAGRPRSYASYDPSRAGFPLRQQLARLPALPDTERELRDVAALQPADSVELLLGAQATARRMRAAQPGRFRRITFATHGLMAGALPGLAEPALVLTPENGSDGLLYASDIAAMDLDADLVVLSACNTAAPDGTLAAEGLSGLARAFLLAGARALLVSHWSVASMVTVRLMTDFAAAEAAEPRPHRAEALRRAMLGMMDDPQGGMAHPALWGAFTIVGR